MLCNGSECTAFLERLCFLVGGNPTPLAEDMVVRLGVFEKKKIHLTLYKRKKAK